MIDYYTLAGFHSDEVEDRSLDEHGLDGHGSDERGDAVDGAATRFDAKPYAVAPKRPTRRPLDIARRASGGEKRRSA